MTLNDLANKHGTDKGDGNYDRHNYAHTYDSLISAIKTSPLRMLEIGIWDPRNPGASMRMWREFLPDAEIFGIDVNVGCLVLQDECKMIVHIANQGNAEALKRIGKEIGPLDFIIDDGSHIAVHQKTSFDVLWPLIKPGGFYAIEDLHAPQSEAKEILTPFAYMRGAKIVASEPKLLIAQKP